MYFGADSDLSLQDALFTLCIVRKTFCSFIHPNKLLKNTFYMKAQLSANRTLSWMRHDLCPQKNHPIHLSSLNNPNMHMCIIAALKTIWVPTIRPAPKSRTSVRNSACGWWGCHASLWDIVLLPWSLLLILLTILLSTFSGQASKGGQDTWRTPPICWIWLSSWLVSSSQIKDNSYMSSINLNMLINSPIHQHSQITLLKYLTLLSLA